MVESRKWVASKLLPRVYSDRTEIVGAGGGPLVRSFPGALLEDEKERTWHAARMIAFALAGVDVMFPDRRAEPIEHQPADNVVQLLKPVA